MFLKPHANTEAGRKFLHEQLSEVGITVRKDGFISAEEIESLGIIDDHYGSLAMKALQQSPETLLVSAEAGEAFKEVFGLRWLEALKSGRVCNAQEAMQRFNYTAEELERRWAPLQFGEGKVKLGSGCYCGLIDGIFVINGFYMVMRSKYIRPGSSVYWLSVEWPAKQMSWRTFRKEVIGNTDPARAAPGSLRGLFCRDWQQLGLPGEPHAGENAVHASASPLEALAERCNWLQIKATEDPIGAMLLDHGVPPKHLHSWLSDPPMKFNGAWVSAFDVFEDKDTAECLEIAQSLAGELGPAAQVPAVGRRLKALWERLRG